jgi:protein involved in polysaccharide export with SLBB domain
VVCRNGLELRRYAAKLGFCYAVMRFCPNRQPEHTDITLIFKLRPCYLLQLTLLLWCAMPTMAEEAEGFSSYTLNTGDHVQVTVFEEPDLSLSAVLDDTGAISYPLLGELKVSGLTARQLEAKITEGLRGRFLIKPRVNFSMME